MIITKLNNCLVQDECDANVISGDQSGKPALNWIDALKNAVENGKY